METKKRALGIGLEQLFNNENLDLNSFEEKVYETATNEEIIEVNLNGNNTKEQFSDFLKMLLNRGRISKEKFEQLLKRLDKIE